MLAGASFLSPKKKGFARCLIGWLIGGLDSGFVSTGGGFSLDYGYNAGYRVSFLPSWVKGRVCGLAYGDKVGRERRLTITILPPGTSLKYKAGLEA